MVLGYRKLDLAYSWKQIKYFIADSKGMVNQKSCTVRDLQSLVGNLQHTCNPGRTFVRRIFKLLKMWQKSSIYMPEYCWQIRLHVVPLFLSNNVVTALSAHTWCYPHHVAIKVVFYSIPYSFQLSQDGRSDWELRSLFYFCYLVNPRFT